MKIIQEAPESENESNQFHLVVKNYKTQIGLSSKLHDDNNTKPSLKFKGPLGKSLRLQKFGYHVAFLAGTGVLVFMDLVATLVKVNLGAI
jgi:hypothetical protein